MNKIRVHEIDLFRFIAAIAVVFYHFAFRGGAGDNMCEISYPALSPIAKYGYLGVELFFLISGFVILMTAMNGSLKKFIISRVVRLYPAFWVCCTVTVLFTLLIGDGRYSVSGLQYLANMTMMSDFIRVPSIDGVYWSLFAEIKFYVFIAIILGLGYIKHIENILIGWLIFSLLMIIYPVKILIYGFNADYAPLFSAGAIFYLIFISGVNLKRILILIACFILANHFAYMNMDRLETKYHAGFQHYVITLLLVVFFTILYLSARRKIPYIGQTQWIILGALTYPLYLIHENVGFMIMNWLYPTISNIHVLFWGTIVLVIGFSYLVNTQVENRFSKPFKTKLEWLFDNWLKIG